MRALSETIALYSRTALVEYASADSFWTLFSANPAIPATTIAAMQASRKLFIGCPFYSAGVAIGWRCDSFGPVRASSCSSQSA